ncbi:MAG: hypothetical protein H7Y20_08055 [Bryobacteraceae bacterium]|nr:hypothetical protein [Bryobacteraceae bacterium]
MHFRCLLLLALSLISAGAQVPEEQTAIRLLQKFVETADPALLDQVQSTLESAPAAAQKTNRLKYLRARLEFARGNFEKSLSMAKALNRDVPDELDPYGLIVDSARALGKSGEAEKAAQWMLNLRPEDFRGLQKAAALREDLEDYQGAEEFLMDAYKRVPRSEPGQRASILAQLARVYIKNKRPADARRLIDESLKLIPGYHPSIILTAN